MESSRLTRGARALRPILAAALLALAGVAIARYVAAVGGRPQGTPVVVAFGDSLTEGGGFVSRPWPAVLADRLQRRSGGGRVDVVNAGISGNRLLRDDFGPSGVRRFRRDALDRAGARWVIVLEGINDLGYAGSADPGAPPVTADELIAGFRQLIAQARGAGVKIYGGTLLPFEGAVGGYFAPDKERVRQAVNAWMRTSGELDAVIDFDAAVRDPDRPARLRPAYDTGDHLHLNAAGQRAMGEAVDLRLFGDAGEGSPRDAGG
ncbi:MAG TPA: SGNH/GDSL hydrolase family protein [Myxococcaceae bacterium]|nr:SGNH/GDSL hydrolase family protein [Myxococcaceae bacterium]